MHRIPYFEDVFMFESGVRICAPPLFSRYAVRLFSAADIWTTFAFSRTPLQSGSSLKSSSPRRSN